LEKQVVGPYVLYGETDTGTGKPYGIERRGVERPAQRGLARSLRPGGRGAWSVQTTSTLRREGG